MDRLRRRRVLRVSLLLLVLVVAGCGVGRPASTTAWQSSTHRTLGTVISGLGTAKIALREAVQGDLEHTYAVVAATDAIDTSTKEVATYAASQPPDRLHAAHHDVVAALDDGIALIVDVRVSLASPGVSHSRATQLLDAIDAMNDRLDKLDKAVEKSPASVVAQ
jgi:hypothetical protein